MGIIDGTYDVTVEGLGHTATSSIDLAIKGKEATGTVHILGQDLPLERGKVDGQSISGQVHADTPLGKHKLKVSATVDGERISGKIKTLVGSGTFEGTRRKAEQA